MKISINELETTIKSEPVYRSVINYFSHNKPVTKWVQLEYRNDTVFYIDSNYQWLNKPTDLDVFISDLQVVRSGGCHFDIFCTDPLLDYPTVS